MFHFVIHFIHAEQEVKNQDLRWRNARLAAEQTGTGPSGGSAVALAQPVQRTVPVTIIIIRDGLRLAAVFMGPMGGLHPPPFPPLSLPHPLPLLAVMKVTARSRPAKGWPCLMKTDEAEIKCLPTLRDSFITVSPPELWNTLVAELSSSSGARPHGGPSVPLSIPPSFPLLPPCLHSCASITVYICVCICIR